MTSTDWATKDFYAELGVKKNASAEQIKKAYRALAREFHPDSHPGDPAAEERFKAISEAYSVLSSPDKRKEYDEARAYFGGGIGFGGAGRGGAPGAGAGFDIGDILGGVFGGGRQRGTRAQGRRGQDLETETTLTFEQAVDGITVPLRLAGEEACRTCNGTGARPGSVPTVCGKCEGSGMQTGASGGLFAMTEPCDECRGRGLIVENPCGDCRGSGRAASSRTIQVKIPAGVKDGQRIKLRGKGGRGDGGGPPGDLFVNVRVSGHRMFGRKGDHLTIDLPVRFDEAVLGATVQVPTLGGKPVSLKIPAGTPSGRTFRVRGKGVAKAGPSTGSGPAARGDLLATVRIDVPEDLSDEARAAVEALREAWSEENPRARLTEDA